VRYGRSLLEIAQSKSVSTCQVRVRSASDSSIIWPWDMHHSYPHATRMPVPLIDGEHIVYARPDLSDLEDLCAYYIEHREARERIAVMPDNISVPACTDRSLPLLSAPDTFTDSCRVNAASRKKMPNEADGPYRDGNQ